MSYEKIVASLRYCAAHDCSPRCPRAGTGRGCIMGLKQEAAAAIEELQHVHQLDMAEIVRLRREVEARQ